MNNLILMAAMIAAVYVWWRSGFRLPGYLKKLEALVRPLLVLAGCLVIVLITVSSLGDIVTGHVHASYGPVHHVERIEHPGLFWTQIAFQLVVGLIPGAALIGMARARPRSKPLAAAGQ